MSNWKYTLNIGKIWNDNELPVNEKGKKIAHRITKMIPSSWLDYNSDDYDEEIEDIIERFNNVTGYEDVTPVEEFDDVMDQLYDWADQEIAPFDKWPRNAMCWVETKIK